MLCIEAKLSSEARNDGQNTNAEHICESKIVFGVRVTHLKHNGREVDSNHLLLSTSVVLRQCATLAVASGYICKKK